VLALAAAALVDRSLPADARRGMIMANVGDVVPLSLTARRAPSNDDPVVEALQRRLEERFAVRAAALAAPAPADPEATFRVDRPPNVLVIIVEGLRYDAAARGLVPRLSRWGAQGLTLGRHYANANRTETALFSLLYSRWPLTYHVTLDAAVRPQLTESLRRAGYRTHFLGTWQGSWLRMEEYLDERAFDEATSVGDGTADTRDHRVLLRAAELLQADGGPRLVVVFLLSSHMPYVSPAAYGQLMPTPLGRGPLAERLWISYARSLAFLDDEIGALVERLDPTRNLIVVTGDHGESFDDDGKLSHGSRWSDAQCRALAYVVGPGIPRRTVQTATAHADVLPTVLHALAGRHVSVAHSSGRDLLDPPDAPDEAMLCQPRRDGQAGMAMVRGDARLALDTDLVGRRVEVAGFRDERGAPLPEHGTPLAAVSGWTASFDRALAGLTE
jgi:membrane-anchored protein YejM (alkaline phosphatase superfamily)